MSFALRPPSSRTALSNPVEGYDSSDSTDSEGTTRAHTRSRTSFLASRSNPRSDFLFPPTLQPGRSSVSSTATSTPVPSRSTSPLPQFYSNPSSSCTSDTDSEPSSPLLRNTRNLWWRENRHRWWTISPRRRRRGGRIIRVVRKWTRRLVRHPFFPSQPITIVLTLILLSVFAILLTLLLIYILNPDKEPLPWRAYCAIPSFPASYDTFTSSYPYVDPSSGNTSPFPSTNLDTLSPAGIFVGVFSVDSEFERRMLVRTTWASHPRSRDGADESDDSVGTSRTIVRFILGQPRKDWERRIKLEMELYNDIVILPISENMNGGKTHTFFSWASINAWVPPIYTNYTVLPPQFSYSNITTSPPPLAPHDSFHAWQDRHSGKLKSWVRPDFVVKVDDDSFVMLAELESRLRLELHAKPRFHHGPSAAFSSTPRTEMTSMSVHTDNLTVTPGELRHLHVLTSVANAQDPLIYWGYLVTNRLHKFMAGELYALTWSLVDWVAKDPSIKGLTRGAEDKQTAKWMKLHPLASEIRWVSERCWIYDHPRSGTVYAHGFLYPSEVTRVKRSITAYLDSTPQDVLFSPTSSMGSTSPTPPEWAYSTVSTFGVRYTPPLPDLSTTYSVEALVEGSDMSLIREGNPMTPDYAWKHREGRRTRYEGKRVGGTVVVHFIKKNRWYLETALALLEGDELSESEKFRSRELEKAALEFPPLVHSNAVQRAGAKYKLR